MNNDLISRSALLDVMRYAIDDAPMYIAATVDQQITEAPAVDAEVVRHGHWIAVGWDDESVTPAKFRRAGYKCSVCDIGTAIKSSRCPRCGAKMDGGVENVV